MSESSSRSSAISLPAGYKLYCWKVRNGCLVRAGETVALSVPVSAVNDDSNTGGGGAVTASTGTKPQHKRPTRRKRPVAATVPSTDKNNNEKNDSVTVATKLPAAVSGLPEKGDGDTKKSAPPRSATSLKKGKHVSPVARTDATSTSLKKGKHVSVVARTDGFVRISMQSTTGEGNTIIGFIEPCLHPTVIEGLCAVCGNKPDKGHSDTASLRRELTKMETSEASKKNNKQQQMSHMTVAGLTVTVSEAEGQRIAQEDALRLQKQKKLSLVLDLDHTLVHATADQRAREHLHSRDDVRSLVLPVVIMEGQQQRVFLQQHFVKFRPHLKEFLESVRSLYEIGVYTAGTREYAEQITILLSRHLVGSRRDQVELDQLRKEVSHIEHEYKMQEQKTSAAKSDEKQKADEHLKTNGATQGAQPKQDDVSPKDDNGSNQEEDVGKKRKRVTFGELPPSTRTNQISKEHVENLRAELAEAERLEREAWELRQRLFGSRVVSRTDVGDLGQNVKSLKRIFPCGGNMAAVIDDREDVWANAADIKSTRRGEPPENLLLVRPYHWSLFSGFADVNNASGVDLSGQDVAAESEWDNQLLWTKDVLQRLHKRYYSYDGPEKPTVPQILATMRSEVLSGCQIVLSGLVPLHKQNLGPDLPRPPFIRYAESLGAQVHSTVTKSVTHVVAANDGTDKILAARLVRGCRIVKASWLMECAWSLSRKDETNYLLGSVSSKASTSAGVDSGGISRAQTEETKEMQPLADSTRDNSSTSGSSDEDDDDLVAELEAELELTGGDDN